MVTTTDQTVRSYALDADEILSLLEVDPVIGLTDDDVVLRQSIHGSNQLRTRKRISLFLLILAQFSNPVVYLLVAAAGFSLIFQEYAEFIAIVVVLLINATIGVVTEWRAIRSMDALRELSTHDVRVRRNGEVFELAAGQLVPGDIVIIEAGDVVAADMRIIQAARLSSDESALTGESLPAEKTVAAVAADSILAERSSMLFKGCAINSGTGEAVVTGIGMQTELGRITQLVDEAETSRSPLEDQLALLSRDMIGFTLIVTAIVGLTGVLVGQDLDLMVQSAVALAVATIPEGLPIVATLALARGMRHMAKHNALIERLSAVETLGATTLIMTDKTGTLTENRMHVSTLVTSNGSFSFDANDGCFTDDRKSQPISVIDDPLIMQLLHTGALCNNATLGNNELPASGDTMEIALLNVANAAGIQRQQLIKQYQELEEHPFDTSTRRMATVHQHGDSFIVAVKGAPESLFDIVQTVASSAPLLFDTDQRQRWSAICTELASRGLRLLAFAGKTVDKRNVDDFAGLTLFGIVGFRDPPRRDIRQAIADTQDAGITVIMVTGDHAETARSIAVEVGMISENTQVTGGQELGSVASMDPVQQATALQQRVFSRVSPEQKLELVALHQNAGEVVAMTGDGINDAPALKQADIGIAMGLRGTQVAREAADIVLRDDSYSTIVHAVREGRVVFTNIRRFTIYLLSCNLSEILVVALALLAGLPLPLLPLQILFLNLVTDVFPAFALGTVDAGRDMLERPPRSSSEPILGQRQWMTIAVHGSSITLATLAALYFATVVLDLEGDAITSVSFYTLALAQLWHVFNMRNWRDHWLGGPLSRNIYVWAAVLFCLFILAIAASTPMIASTLRLVDLGLQAWGVIVLFSMMPVMLREISGLLTRRSHRAQKS